MLSATEKRLQANTTESIERLFHFLEIPSISTDSSHDSDCVAAAEWLAGELTSIGIDARLVPATRHPAIIAHGPKVKNALNVLFYGHYDVQPPEPLDEWESHPFDPAIKTRDGREVIHGRGAADDKGQLMTFVEACRALHESSGIPLNLTFLIEGEEEIGSPSVKTLLETYKDELSADIALICDTGMLDFDSPAIGCQLRGFVGEIITIEAATSDLHSGNYGGAARNPALVMSKILASIVNTDGSISLPDFYEGVEDTSEELMRDWKQLTSMEANLLEEVGLKIPAGEHDRSVLEQVWARPSFDINSLSSGYVGPGFKTVLPSTAQAKVSFRLVGNQDPHKIREVFRREVRKFVPVDCKVNFEAFGTVPAVEMDISRNEFTLVKDAIRGVWKNPCVFIGMGGSIPIVTDIKKLLGLDTVLLGFSLSDDHMHAPNEKYDLECFRKGALSWLRILRALEG